MIFVFFLIPTLSNEVNKWEMSTLRDEGDRMSLISLELILGSGESRRF